jgi:CP family cyanate transporter-like MFS transporter
VAAIILLGLNLRPILAAIGPLLDSIQASTGISNADAGLLTTVPVFAMGVCALAGAQLQRRLGVARGIAWASPSSPAPARCAGPCTAAAA